jgi:hypothetical protein
MRISEQFPSKYLSAADCEDDLTLIIDRVKIEEVGTDKDKKPVLYFDDTEKGLVLNKTNAGTISALYGDDTNDWKGEAITLFSAMVSYQGKTTPGVRMKAPSKKKAAAAATASGGQKKISVTAEVDDGIPF